MSDIQNYIDSIEITDCSHHSQQENHFVNLISSQKLAIVPSFVLESGDVLYEVPVAFKTWGKLNAEGTNCLLICHALSGSADAADWWGPLMGPGRAFDPQRFFIVCLNSLGSPYGSASPVTWNPETQTTYGPEFPLTTVRDDVQIHKLVLQRLGVKHIAMAVGGSMGGMLVLEWAFDKDFVGTIVPIATSLRHSAWCISWCEAQRQSIYSDPHFKDGYYEPDEQPVCGLGAARMAALLTYRTKGSFERRFSRAAADTTRHPYPDHIPTPLSNNDARWVVHNEGNINRSERPARSSGVSTPTSDMSSSFSQPPSLLSRRQSNDVLRRPMNTYFSAQSYLRYQANKFVKRFDANCYISITRKLDTHDVMRDRADTLEQAMQAITQPALVMGIETDGLFTFDEQVEIVRLLKNGTLKSITSAEGHDGFLLEFDQVNSYILEFQKEHLQQFLSSPLVDEKNTEGGESLTTTRESVFGEMEDMASW
ncbi:homoserine O-acetyltransferase [Schizosaccharomyces japonicus yFS275]|uniref:Homoserine O-acetyltransferase n=1 Tax=Schizosaccharomyces japonicus (strain yFS275 / FY16936) TaxID=402676 RepID=B6JVI4_SCHJY|nr:homoserine O-acetyltransferase [Schizosaccharomyces japonicus yFS275]EEB05385.1 homoserine O-acetyltransferase [Schizosaccharomyces japonicus yFS275]